MTFAQGHDIAPWAGLGGVIASSGFAAVVAWYLLTRALPKMQEAQDKALAAAQSTFSLALLTQQETFERIVREQIEKHDKNEEIRRADSKAGLTAVLEHCERERKDQSQEIEQLGQQNERISLTLEEVRRDLEDFGVERRNRRRRGPQPPVPPSGTAGSQV